MKISTSLNKHFAHKFWNSLSAIDQKVISIIWSVFYRTKMSSFLIKPFTVRYKINPDEMKKYLPASGLNSYKSFQDFFTRKLAEPFKASHTSIFPCEGLVCESGQVGQLNAINVKGRFFSVRNIFGHLGINIPDSHFFINIFLHNHNYHRFHAPVTGVVKSVYAIPGQLNFLRPWLYAVGKVSEPAFVNERVVVEIEESEGQSWFLSFVGGMGVGKIKMHDYLKPGYQVGCGEEIGLFLLGSTCCIAAPRQSITYKFLTKVKLGDSL